MANILITGIDGFIGSSLAAALVERGDNVIGIRRSSRPFSSLSALNLEHRVTIRQGDLVDQRMIEEVLQEYQIDMIYHLAADSIVNMQKSPASVIQNNVMSTLSVLEAAKNCHVKMHFASSDKVYGNNPVPYTEDMPLLPSDAYSSSKVMCDVMTRMYSQYMPTIVTRMCNVYGPGDLHPTRIIPKSIQRCLHGNSPEIYSNLNIREYMYIDDAVRALLDVWHLPHVGPGEAYNIGSGYYMANAGVVENILFSFPGIKPRRIDTQGLSEIQSQSLDSSKFRKQTGWQPLVDFNDGIERTVEWWRRLKWL
jgi:CDP-glucose 4,6-dehydratase